jgi:hypothetical protein
MCSEDALNKKPISLLDGAKKQRPAVRRSHSSRWTRGENIHKYRRLLATQLTDIEREFVEGRLAEELSGRWTGSRGVLRNSSLCG